MNRAMLSYAEARDYLRSIGVDIAEQTLRRYVSEGRLDCVRLPGRTYIEKAVLDGWIERCRVAATGTLARSSRK